MQGGWSWIFFREVFVGFFMRFLLGCFMRFLLSCFIALYVVFFELSWRFMGFELLFQSS